MEESLRERQSINESLKQQLNESQARDVVDAAENSGHLQEANAMIDKLKKTIAALQTEKQVNLLYCLIYIVYAGFSIIDSGFSIVQSNHAI